METLLEVKNLKKHFPVNKGWFSKDVYLKAVDDISFKIRKGETLGIVGESGCGKSTAGRCILGLHKNVEGEVVFKGTNILSLNKSKLMSLRPKFQMIFQDPYSSLNPNMTLEKIISQAPLEHKIINKSESKEYVEEVLNRCGLAKYHLKRYPHEFSGGQRQRIGIARALALNPEFIVADEPVSALDVSIQAQIINLLIKSQKDLGLSYLFISHDLSVVRHICHRVGVMYLGSLMEIADKKDLYKNPCHPYTKALLSSIPIPNPKIKREKILIKGEIPSPINPPIGCKFHTRCPYAKEACKEVAPKVKEIEKNHFVACHLY